MVCIMQVRVDGQVGALEGFTGSQDMQINADRNLDRVLFPRCSKINPPFRNTWLLSDTTDTIPFPVDSVGVQVYAQLIQGGEA